MVGIRELFHPAASGAELQSTSGDTSACPLGEVRECPTDADWLRSLVDVQLSRTGPPGGRVWEPAVGYGEHGFPVSACTQLFPWTRSRAVATRRPARQPLSALRAMTAHPRTSCDSRFLGRGCIRFLLRCTGNKMVFANPSVPRYLVGSLNQGLPSLSTEGADAHSSDTALQR